MTHFTDKNNRKIAILIILITNILSLVISIGGIAGLKITKGTENGTAYAFTGNLFLACFTIFLSLLMIILFIILFLKQSDVESTLFSKWNKGKLNTFFILLIILSFIIIVASIIVFIQRDNAFRWYGGWWRNFGKIGK